jgi:NAD(P)-dependent dehydrogenase (short-subunit alcohol dehydrogenase family)
VDLRLAGRVVLISGASRGLGRACALAFAAEGARLALAARGEADLRATAAAATAGGAETHAVVADVTRDEDVRRLVADVLARYGRIDVLVNNAGAGLARAFAEVDGAAWQASVELNLLGAVRLIRAVLPAMREQAEGWIVNVAALSGKRPRLGQIASNATKAALINLTESLAGELAPHGIRVNAVCPGLVRNARWEARIREAAAARGVSADEAAAVLGRENIPLGRLGAAEDVAPLVVFLASPVAANYITGVSVEVDGGLGRCVTLRGL